MPQQFQAQGQISIRVVAKPADTNSNGDIFGGWLVSHMDLAASSEASRRAQSRVVTVAIDTLTFIKPVGVGDLVCCYTKILQIGRTSMQIQVEVSKICRRYSDEVKVAEGLFTFVSIDDQGKPHPVDR